MRQLRILPRRLIDFVEIILNIVFVWIWRRCLRFRRNWLEYLPRRVSTIFSGAFMPSSSGNALSVYLLALLEISREVDPLRNSGRQPTRCVATRTLDVSASAVLVAKGSNEIATNWVKRP
ncbi:hypothetical protein MA20_46265 [Bradyrhizobium japonicum]|uniref:Uncharacterized protein n=2 Tax=Bradyrhizobium TaxID=374 RepID=A0A837CEF9_9BRAD|nr:hypothetical protein BJS_08909 [Bradyrhizobium japonicum SEMIA 5079]KGJ67388.1 hypothetical protein BJA5080_07750 [Bradyrhizobium diazoefficiens SEMIA 5080]KGT73119.1 hypothetical protein MA20_46265 [Bradyrhizobium japonicum]